MPQVQVDRADTGHVFQGYANGVLLALVLDDAQHGDLAAFDGVVDEIHRHAGDVLQRFVNPIAKHTVVFGWFGQAARAEGGQGGER